MHDINQVFTEKFNEKFNSPDKEFVDISQLGGVQLLTGRHEKIRWNGDTKGSVIGSLDDDGQGFIATCRRWSNADKFVINHSAQGVNRKTDKEHFEEWLAELPPEAFKPVPEAEGRKAAAAIRLMAKKKRKEEIAEAKRKREEAAEPVAAANDHGGPDSERGPEMRFPPINPSYKHLYAIYDLIMKSSIKPRKELALAASLAAMAGVAAKAQVCYRSGRIKAYPCLFVVMAAHTGEGKDAPRSIIERILIDPLIKAYGSGDYRSAPALANSFDDGLPAEGDDPKLIRKRNHLRLDVSDEFIELFRRSNQVNAPAHQSAIQDVLCKLFSAPGGVFPRGRYSSSTADPKEYVESPCVSYLGSATIRDLEQHISQANLDKGIVPRLLFFLSTDKQGYVTKHSIDTEETMERVITGLSELMHMYTRIGPDVDPSGWTNLDTGKDVNELIDDIYEKQSKQMDACGDNENLRAILSRHAELAMRVAVVLAVSRGGKSLCFEDIETGMQIVKWCQHSASESMDMIGKSTENEKDLETLRHRIEGLAVRNKKTGCVYDSMLRQRSRKLTSRRGYYEHLIDTLVKEDFITVVTSEKANKPIGYLVKEYTPESE